MNKPLRGQLWFVRLDDRSGDLSGDLSGEAQRAKSEAQRAKSDPTEGHEQAKTRPCLIISNNRFNAGAADLVIVVPLTSKNKAIPLHIMVGAGPSGLSAQSFIMPEHIRSLSVQRCVKLIGAINKDVLSEAEEKIKILLDFD